MSRSRSGTGHATRVVPSPERMRVMSHSRAEMGHVQRCETQRWTCPVPGVETGHVKRSASQHLDVSLEWDPVQGLEWEMLRPRAFDMSRFDPWNGT